MIKKKKILLLGYTKKFYDGQKEKYAYTKIMNMFTQKL